jgi:hypothetical protein
MLRVVVKQRGVAYLQSEPFKLNYFVRYTYMGIIVHEPMTTETGIVVNDYYINVGTVRISKQILNPIMYDVWTEYNCFANKLSRTDNKDPFHKFAIHLETETLNDIHTQIYTKIKETHGNSTDDL